MKDEKVTAWTERIDGALHAVIRVGDDLYTFGSFDHRPAAAEKLGGGVEHELLEREAAVSGLKAGLDKRQERLAELEESLNRLKEKLEKRERRSRKLMQAANWEQKLKKREEEVAKREQSVSSELTSASVKEHQGHMALKKARELTLQARADMESADAAARSRAEDRLRRAVKRARDEAQETRDKARVVLKHLEDELAKVRKREALVERRVEALPNLMCGNVQDVLEVIK